MIKLVRILLKIGSVVFGVMSYAQAQTTQIISNPSVSQSITQPVGTSLTVNTLCSGTGPVNARTCFGATGNANWNVGGCSITAGATTLTCPGLNFDSADIGKTIYIAGAGSGGGTLQTSITNVSGMGGPVAFVGDNAVTTVSSSAVFYATDDTVNLQAAFNAARAQNRPLYIPAGTYLHHGLDFTGADSRIFGDSLYSVTQLVGAAVTNPTQIHNAPTVGIDISGSSRNIFDHLNVWGGWQNGMGDLAPTINVLAARTTSDPSTDHTFEDDFFITSGAYDVFLYGYEQTSFKDCTFEGDGATVSGLLYLSANNTPGFQSPYRTFSSTPTSMTKVSSSGAASVFSGVGNHIVLDQGGAESDYTISIRDAYISLSGGGTWLSDVGGSPVRDIELSNDYAEIQTCPTCKMINMTAPAKMWDIRTLQAYNTAGGGMMVTPYTFAGGLLGSYIQVDGTGQAPGSGLPMLSASSCLGSIINTGQEQPSASCQDYTLAPNVNSGGPVQAINNFGGIANIPMSGTSANGGGMGNNATGGTGEVDFYNMFIGSGGFNFYQNTNAGYFQVGRLGPDGMHINSGNTYWVGTSQGITGTATAGSCVLTITAGIITAATGC